MMYWLVVFWPAAGSMVNHTVCTADWSFFHATVGAVVDCMHAILFAPAPPDTLQVPPQRASMSAALPTVVWKSTTVRLIVAPTGRLILKTSSGTLFLMVLEVHMASGFLRTFM